MFISPSSSPSSFFSYSSSSFSSSSFLFLFSFLFLLLLGQPAAASLGPGWLSPSNAYGAHVAFLPAKSGEHTYPMVTLHAGSPEQALDVEPRWDLQRPALGYAALSTLQTSSHSLVANALERSELFELGSAQLRLDVSLGDAGQPLSLADGRQCRAQHPERRPQPEGALSLSPATTLWRHWTSWSLGPTRLLLGTHRPHRGYRHAELLGNASSGIPILLPAMPPPPLVPAGTPRTLLVDLNCDYTYVPHDVYVRLLSSSSSFSSLSSSHSSSFSSLREEERARSLRVCGAEDGAVCFALAHHVDGVEALRWHGLDAPVVVLGRLHAERFLVGEHVTRDELSVLPLDVFGPPIDELDMLVWFAALLLLHAAWLLMVMPGALESVQRRLLHRYHHWETAPTDKALAEHDTSIFAVGNTAFLRALTAITRLVIVCVAVTVVVGYRAEQTINIDLPAAYSQALVAFAVGAALLASAWPAADYRDQDIALLGHHQTLALRTAAWLFASLRYDLWIAQVIMLMLAATSCIRTGELVLAAGLASQRNADSVLWPRQRLWLALFLVEWLLAAWIFGGYTVPLLIDTWWATLVYRVEIATVIAILLAVGVPAYTTLTTRQLFIMHAVELYITTNEPTAATDASSPASISSSLSSSGISK